MKTGFGKLRIAGMFMPECRLFPEPVFYFNILKNCTPNQNKIPVIQSSGGGISRR